MDTILSANQPPPLQITTSLHRTARCWTRSSARRLDSIGQTLAARHLSRRCRTIELGFDANRNTPELRTHDRFGERIDEVHFHPAYHALMCVAVTSGLHAAPWLDREPNAHLRRAAKFFVWSQVEGGHLCPISMTYAAVLCARTRARACARMDRQTRGASLRSAPRAGGRERGGNRRHGHDRKAAAPTCAAIRRAQTAPATRTYVLAGHKWFCTAPMCDAFLVLAQAEQGLSSSSCRAFCPMARAIHLPSCG